MQEEKIKEGQGDVPKGGEVVSKLRVSQSDVRGFALERGG